MTATEDKTMGRKRTYKKEDWEMTRFSKDLLRKARMVIAAKPKVKEDDGLLSVYISEAARRQIEADHKKLVEEEAKKLSKPSKD